MKAAWYSENGKAKDVLQYGDLPDPEPDQGEVRVRLRTSGINPADVKWREGLRFPIPFDLVIPHFDGGGEIDAVGPGVDKSRIGERVWVFEAQWQNPFGTAAQYVTVPANRAVPLPKTASFEVAAGLGIPAITAYYGAANGGTIEGKTLLVTGAAGGVGFYAAQFAALLGASVIALVRSDEQQAIIEKTGIQKIVRSDKPDIIEQIQTAAGGKEAIDRFVEVDLAANMPMISNLAHPEAYINAYASMSDFHPPIPFYEIFAKNLTIHPYLALTLSERAKEEAVLKISQWLEKDLLVHHFGPKFPLAKIVEAQEYVEDQPRPGKVILEID